MSSFIERRFGQRVSFFSQVHRDVTERMTPECRASIEAAVREWLKKDYDHTDGSMGKLQFDLKDDTGKGIGIDGTIVFTRYEVQMHTCANQWDVYRVAHACNWPEPICVRYASIGVNLYGIPGTEDPPPVNTLVSDFQRHGGLLTMPAPPMWVPNQTEESKDAKTDDPGRHPDGCPCVRCLGAGADRDQESAPPAQ